MNHLFWLRPQRIAGRAGPTMAPWQPQALAAGGIGAILTVNDGGSVYPDDLAAAGIEHASHPMEDNAPPRDGDLERCLEVLPVAYEFVTGQLAQGRRVLIHCTAGKDRTGLTMAYYLCRAEGYNPRDAITEVRRVRPEGLSAIGYEAFAIDILQRLAGRR